MASPDSAIDIDPTLTSELSETQRESLQELLSQFARDGRRILLNVVGPTPVRLERVTYGNVCDDQRTQFSGGINNREVGMPVWE